MRFYLDVTVWNRGSSPGQVFLHVNGKVPLVGTYLTYTSSGSISHMQRVVGQEPYERIPAMPWGHLIVEPGRSVRFQELGFIGSGDTLRSELDYTHIH